MFWVAIKFDGACEVSFQLENGTIHAHRNIMEVLIAHAQTALTDLGEYPIFKKQ